MKKKKKLRQLHNIWIHHIIQSLPLIIMLIVTNSFSTKHSLNSHPFLYEKIFNVKTYCKNFCKLCIISFSSFFHIFRCFNFFSLTHFGSPKWVSDHLYIAYTIFLASDKPIYQKKKSLIKTSNDSMIIIII